MTSSMVFIVEDDAEFGTALAELLTDEGFRPVHFSSARKALDSLAADDKPSLIITDLLMPGMSGVQLVRALRGDDRWRTIPVVVLTGGNDAGLAVRLDTPVVYKPDIDSLLRILPATTRPA
jgi:FixJ family two-component response regulator